MGGMEAAFHQPWGVENEGEERERGFLYRHMERTSWLDSCVDRVPCGK